MGVFRFSLGGFGSIGTILDGKARALKRSATKHLAENKRMIFRKSGKR